MLRHGDPGLREAKELEVVIANHFEDAGRDQRPVPFASQFRPFGAKIDLMFVSLVVPPAVFFAFQRYLKSESLRERMRRRVDAALH
jgi:hypothetical protein